MNIIVLTMDFKFEDILKTQMIMALQSHEKTIISYILMFVFFIIVSYSSPIKIFIEEHLLYYNQKQFSIELVGSIYEDRFHTRRIFSKRFISLLHYLHKTDLTKFHKPVRKLLEICIEDMENIGKGHENVDDMIVHQQEPIMLTDDIHCKFEFHSNENTSEKNNIKYTNIKVEVYSKSKPVKELQSFIDHCMSTHDNYLQNLLQRNIYNFIYDKDEDGVPCFKKIVFKSNKSFDNVFFAQKEELMRRLDFFTSGQETYKKFGIPHTFGVLMHGEPGTGKTSTIKAIVNYTQRHIISVPLQKINDISVLLKLFMNEVIDDVKVPFDKRIYVFEEIDCNGLGDILQQRKDNNILTTTNNVSDDVINKLREQLLENNNVSMKDVNNILSVAYSPVSTCKNQDKSITLGSLLELLDGVVETPGRIIIMTTNYPEKLDKALIRPRRIDMNIHFSKTSKQDIKDMFHLWFNKLLTDEEVSYITPEKYSHAELCKLFFNNLNDSDNVLHELQYNMISSYN
jgi:predicted AAA+ superfamily ATPase